MPDKKAPGGQKPGRVCDSCPPIPRRFKPDDGFFREQR
jgi:hypothetical protein